MRSFWIGAFGALLAGAAAAQPSINPAGSTSAQQGPLPWHFGTAQRAPIMAWAPYQAAATGIGTTFNTLGTGRTSLVSVELEGDPIAVQLVLLNASATAWALQQAVVSTSASYGGSAQVGGITPFDILGTELSAFIPVSWNNGGQNSNPWSPTTTRFTGTLATSGYQYLSLPLSGAEAAGQTTLDFASTISGANIGVRQPTAGMYVRDGRGCIADGTTVSSVTATTVVISPAVTAVGCLSGQNIYFSFQPIANLRVGVPPTANGVNGTLVYSDWIAVNSLPRTDGGMIAGMSVSCAGCPTGATVRSVGPTSVTLSGDITATVPINTAVTFTQVQRTSRVADVPQAWVHVSSTTGLQEGQIVTGSPAIPAGTYVAEVHPSGLIRLNASLTGVLDVNTALTFTNTAYTSAATTEGAVLPFTSTSAKRLLLVRSVVESGSPTGNNRHPQLQNATAQYPGLQYSRFMQSTTANDSVNVITNSRNAGTTGGQTSTTPLYAIRYLTKQGGVVVCTMGDSKMAGGGTSGNDRNFAVFAAGQLSTRTRPVTAIQTASGATSGAIFGPQAIQWIQNGTCSVVVAQVNTQNTGNEADTAGYVAMMREFAQRAGVRPILVTDTPRGSRYSYAYRVTADTMLSTTLPLNQALGSGFKNAGGSGYCISGTGIPSGTTFSYTLGATSITLSQPATVAKDTIVSPLNCLTLTTTSGSTSVTLNQAPPITATGIDLTGHPNIAAGTTINITQDSTSATLSANATASGAGTASWWQNPATYIPIAQRGAAAWGPTATPWAPFYDAGWCLMDPADLGYYLPRYSYDGVHPNDEGHLAIAAGVPSAPGLGCPSFTSFLNTIIGN